MNAHQSIQNSSNVAPGTNQEIADIGDRTQGTGRDSVDNDYDGNDDEYDHTEYTNRATPLFDFISQRVMDFSGKAYTDLRNFSDFKAFWRDKFDRMRIELDYLHKSGLFITDPPLKVLEIEILDNAGEKICPCGLNDKDAQIVIRAEQGITRDDLLKALQDHLYSEDAESKDLRLSDRHRGMLVPRDWDCMLEEYNVLYQKSGCSAMRIWMYCSDEVVPHDKL